MNELIFHQTLIDLMFTTWPNLASHSRVHSSLHKNDHHNITFAKSDLHIEYQSPYERVVWNYKQTETLFIQCAINEFNWDNAFSNIDIDKKLRFLANYFVRYLSNHCPSKTIICNDTDPPWLTDKIKTLIEENNALCKSFSKSNKCKFMYNRLAFLGEKYRKWLDQAKRNITTI